ncbi:hypothetical protein ACFS27_09750 [Promicromonospora vindobonensis]|uniref:DUF427 domain-containing protein n=1 Tax=Promicromonospora vindobonensis TaxID=195748 RepID=A0ABW5VTW7_9MICO
MRNTTRRLAVVPARPVRHVEEFVLVVHRPFKSWAYYPPNDGQSGRSEACEIQPGTYPVRAVHIEGHTSAVVDLDTVLTRRTTLLWRIFPRIERPYTRVVEVFAWSPSEVIDGAPMFDDEHTDPVATWHRIA